MTGFAAGVDGVTFESLGARLLGTTRRTGLARSPCLQLRRAWRDSWRPGR